MRDNEYEIMHRYEDHYWWYSALRRLIGLMLHKYGNRKPYLVLDAGCGTGGNLSYLAKELAPSKIIAYDLHAKALELTRAKVSQVNLLQASVNQVPFQKNTFDLVSSFDVISSAGIQDLEAFHEIWRILKPGGIFLINLPAYEFLRGKHDAAVHTQHRYTANELKEKLKSAGFLMKRVTYWNCFLFPVLFVWRKLSAAGTPDRDVSDFRPMPGWANEALKFILRIEEFLISVLNLPFGTSVFAVAQKPF